MATIFQICRICLSVNVKMYKLKYTDIENLYKLLIQTYVFIEDGKPATVCFLCYARLQQCYRLQQQAIKSNELLEQLLRGELTYATAIGILNNQYTSQDLQLSSIYYLNCKPATCESVSFDQNVQANSKISVKQENEAIDEECNMTDFPKEANDTEYFDFDDEQPFKGFNKPDEIEKIVHEKLWRKLQKDLEPVACEDVLLDPTVEANNLILFTEEKEARNEGNNVAGFPENANYSIDFEYQVIKSDPEVDQPSIAVFSNKSDGIKNVAHEKEGRKRQKIENLCIIQDEKRVRNYSHTSNTIQILQKDKTSYNNELAQEIDMTSVRNLQKKKGTLITNKQKNQNTINKNDDKRVDKKSKKKWEKTKTNVVSSNQKIQYPIHDKDTQEENINSPQTSVINTIIGEFQCNECGKQFLTKDILTDHILKCFKTASSSNSQLTKIDTVKSLLSDMYGCGICTFKTNRKRLIVTHLKTHNGTKTFSCKICEYRCLHTKGLKRHMKKHTDEKPFSCNICEYRCAQRTILMTHIKIHTEEKPFSCNICMYRCLQKQNLKRHMRTHTGEKPFSCNICKFKCTQKAKLKEHMRTHTGEKPFSCNICEYRYSRIGDLKTHMRTHTGEKPFSCNICQYRCAQKVHLKTHMRTHTGDKPYSCNMCKFKCTQNAKLKEHMRTHTGEKPFSCDICEYRCARKDQLNVHIRTHS